MLTLSPPSLDLPTREDGLDEAPDIPKPATARAPLLFTPDPAARDPETEGENDPLEPAPATDVGELYARAELVTRPDLPIGLFRAVPCAPVDA